MANLNQDARIQLQFLAEKFSKTNEYSNIPKLIIKGGKITKKAKDFNRLMIKEGKMNSWIDTSEVYNLKTNKVIKKQIVRNKKQIKNPKIDNKKLLNDVLLPKNILDNKTDIPYLKALQRKINNEKKKKSDFTIQADLKKVKYDRILDYIRRFQLNKNNQDWVITGQDPRGQIITFSIPNIVRLKNEDTLTADKGEQRAGSNLDWLMGVIDSGFINLRFFDKTKGITNTNTKQSGAFFKYYHNLKNIDLSRYGVFTEAPKDYKNNCLYLALLNGGLEEEKLNKFKSFVLSSNVPLSKFNEIATILDIHISVRRTLKNDTIVKHFGDKSKEHFRIGLIDNHFFIIEKTNITSFAIENYHEVKDINDYNKIFRIKKNKYDKSNDRFVDSFKAISLLIEHKDKCLTDIPINDVFNTQHYSRVIENDNVNYNPEKETQVNKYKEKSNTNYKIFFDFETTTDLDKHDPYLVSWLTEDNELNNCIGSNCAYQFVEFIRSKYIDCEPIGGNGLDKNCVGDVMIIAHNLRYDFTFIHKYLFALKPILKGNSLMGGSARLGFRDKNDKRWIKIIFHDSNNLIPMRLANFGKTFNLDTCKEIMPYDLYTTKNVNKRMIDLNECLSHYEDNEQLQNEYLSNIKKWRCLFNGKVDIIQYSKIYCDMDCKVLKNGYDKFRSWILEITGLDITNYCSIASIGLDYLVKEGCFDGCYKLAGTPQDFIQKCVVGGRTMCKDNKKWKCTNVRMADFDAVSLYPSAMSRIKGFLKGRPNVIKNKSFKFLNKQDGYFIKVKCLNNPTKNLGFPLLSKCIDGIRNFTNETKDEIFYIDKTCYEDCVNFQGLDFEVICGYYYNKGHNNKINSVIKHLFTQRKEMKKKGNPIQAVYKQLMNSCYGKALLKPIETDIKVVHERDFKKYVSRNYNFIKEMNQSGDFYIVKEQKAINEHFNNVYAGVEILSMSKRIMNEVMVLGEQIGCKIYYTDTDSMHIIEEDIQRLEKEYNKKYDRELIGSNMGQFHTDFDLDNCKDIIATDSIFLGKKCYIDNLEGIDENGKIVKGNHIRMKGVNEAGIKHFLENNDEVETLFDIYEKLYEGKKLAFDLLAGGKCCKFKYNKDLSVSSVSEFVRSVKFDYEEGIEAF